MQTDMTDEGAVERLRQEAVLAFGHIDVWVNCAAVLLFGRFEDVSPGMFRHVLDVNVLGYVHGSQAALRQFWAQGDQGTLINLSSMLGVASEPHASAYVASKFAILGLTSSIRQEMAPYPSIRVCTVLPAAIDTVIYQKAGKFYGRRAPAIVPVCSPDRVARAIISAARRPRREVKVGASRTCLTSDAALPPLSSSEASRDWVRACSSKRPDGNLRKAIFTPACRIGRQPAAGAAIG